MKIPYRYLIILAAFVFASFTPAAAQSGGVKAFTGATLFDGTGKPSITDAVLLVRNGKVEAVGRSNEVSVPRGTQRTDLKGKYVIPGMISTHVHVSDVQGTKPRAYTEENTMRQLGVFARYGMTSVWSLGGEQEPAFKARAEQSTASLDRARLFLSGEIIVAKTPEEARAKVAKVAEGKPDFIKIRVDDTLGTSTKMPPEVYRAVIDEAHKHKLPVAVHIFYLDDAKDLLRSGVDMIAHSVRDKEIDEEFIALMKQRNVPYCPTLTREIATFVYESKPDFFSDPFFAKEADPAMVAQLQEPKRQEAMRTSKSAQRYKEGLVVANRNLKKAADAGVLIVMGTDSGAFPERFQGYFEHLEMKMMQDAGMTPAQVLRSATGDAAKGMGATDVGTLTKGSWADFVVLDKDPLADVSNTKSIASVWIAGNSVKGAGATD